MQDLSSCLEGCLRILGLLAEPHLSAVMFEELNVLRKVLQQASNMKLEGADATCSLKELDESLQSLRAPKDSHQIMKALRTLPAGRLLLAHLGEFRCAVQEAHDLSHRFSAVLQSLRVAAAFASLLIALSELRAQCMCRQLRVTGLSP